VGKKKNSKKTKEKNKKTSPVVETGEDNPYDFGGLPNRNLKKNLGCG